MIGPLAVYESALREGMARRGYANTSVREAVGVMARLSGWMDSHGIGVLTSTGIEQFVAERRERCREPRTARRWVGAVERELLGCGAMTLEEANGDAVATVLAGYREFLRAERSLSAESVRCYLTQGRITSSSRGFPTPLRTRSPGWMPVWSSRSCSSTPRPQAASGRPRRS